MSETIYEFVTSKGTDIRVDAEAGVIRGVKVLGQTSRNGRKYLPQALSSAIAMYEGAKVNVNHPKGQPTAPRDYQDRIGAIRSVRMGTDGCLYADFHFNPKHALAEQLVWDARHAPENVGFSHNVEARTTRNGYQLTIEAITRVQSVDLVADPATTRGLFEGRGRAAELNDRPAEVALLEGVTLDQLERQRPELIDAILESPRREATTLREEVSRLERELSQRRRHELIRQLFAEAEGRESADAEWVGGELVGSEFMRVLHAAESDADVRRLVEERVSVVRRLRDENRTGRTEIWGQATGRPRSRGPAWLSGDCESPDDAKAFSRAIG
jgi:hypothetical protein